MSYFLIVSTQIDIAHDITILVKTTTATVVYLIVSTHFLARRTLNNDVHRAEAVAPRL